MFLNILNYQGVKKTIAAIINAFIIVTYKVSVIEYEAIVENAYGVYS